MWHVGMDWHSKQADLTVRDEGGCRRFSRHVRGGIAAVVAELRKIREPISVTYEASTSYGYLYDELSKVARTVKVAHPGHLRLIFRSKGKKYDEALDGLAKNTKTVFGYEKSVLTEGGVYRGIWLECGPLEGLVYGKHAPEVAKANHEIFFHLQREDG